MIPAADDTIATPEFQRDWWGRCLLFNFFERSAGLAEGVDSLDLMDLVGPVDAVDAVDGRRGLAYALS
jgi:hypothetical protein